MILPILNWRHSQHGHPPSAKFGAWPAAVWSNRLANGTSKMPPEEGSKIRIVVSIDSAPRTATTWRRDPALPRFGVASNVEEDDRNQHHCVGEGLAALPPHKTGMISKSCPISCFQGCKRPR